MNHLSKRFGFPSKRIPISEANQHYSIQRFKFYSAKKLNELLANQYNIVRFKSMMQISL